jgi:RNA recognition motif-containing protein
MDDDSTTPSELLTSEFEMEQRIVFINNLPIDAKEEEIDQIYSRCGPLESVQLFNLRPDLDPGPLSKKQLEERKRKQRINNAPGADTYAMYQRQINQRPRSPVYAILKFQTAEGFNLATCSDMSLFGCVIRRHPVMSIKPRDMKTLYVENIPPNLYSIEVEYKLARLLHPHKVYVMLDGMKGVGRGCQESNNGVADEYQEYAEPSSCEVKFEDFRSANDAYNWMRGEGADGEPLTPSASFMGSDDCQVHWFRTPADATRYWTRELNF